MMWHMHNLVVSRTCLTSGAGMNGCIFVDLRNRHKNGRGEGQIANYSEHLLARASRGFGLGGSEK